MPETPKATEKEPPSKVVKTVKIGATVEINGVVFGVASFDTSVITLTAPEGVALKGE